MLVAQRPGDDDDEFVSDRLGGLRLLQRHERRSKVLFVVIFIEIVRRKKLTGMAEKPRRWR